MIKKPCFVIAAYIIIAYVVVFTFATFVYIAVGDVKNAAADVVELSKCNVETVSKFEQRVEKAEIQQRRIEQFVRELSEK
jgi:soluble P-type ATPase